MRRGWSDDIAVGRRHIFPGTQRVVPVAKLQPLRQPTPTEHTLASTCCHPDAASSEAASVRCGSLQSNAWRCDRRMMTSPSTVYMWSGVSPPIHEMAHHSCGLAEQKLPLKMLCCHGKLAKRQLPLQARSMSTERKLCLFLRAW